MCKKNYITHSVANLTTPDISGLAPKPPTYKNNNIQHLTTSKTNKKWISTLLTPKMT
jgi:hypothetical protein